MVNITPNEYTQTFQDGVRMHPPLSQVTVITLQKIVQPNVADFRSRIHRTRAALYNLIAAAPPSVQKAVQQAVTDSTKGNRKRSREEEGVNEHIAKKVKKGGKTDVYCQDFPATLPEANTVQAATDGPFMKAPPQQVIDGLVQNFIQATGNTATASTVCSVCALEQNTSQVKQVAWRSIPHRERLIPQTPHPQHDLFEGMLMEPKGVDNEKKEAAICEDCLTYLHKNEKPAHALSNNMWIGRPPTVLARLTLPERILVARFFPVAYIFKLMPKRGGRLPNGQLHWGYRGNVSTYRLSPNQVAGMTEGQLMPPPAKILSATIGVTFVTKRQLAAQNLPTMFRVHRKRVHEALQWLKSNNPLYANIEISEERLGELPEEEDVPAEIVDGARVTTDVAAAKREAEGFVPADVMDEGLEEESEEDGTESQPLGDGDQGPEIFHIQTLGVVDAEGVNVTDREMRAHAFNNMANGGEDYAVKRGTGFVNEYPRTDPNSNQRTCGTPDDPNHLLGCFPVLFPYGEGGFEVERDVKVSYEAHARWSLKYHDRRFRLDMHFPFMVFGVLQKRQVGRSAALQVRRNAFAQYRDLVARLKPSDFSQAAREEIQGVPYSNPAIAALAKDLRAVRTPVDGTDENRFTIRSQIWGLILLFFAPSLWITINPADSQDPIAQVFAGENIDLDKFCKTAGPDHAGRAENVARDPYASAKFFHFMIKTILETLYGIKASRGHIQRETGIYGRVQAYVGTVEAQGRGTLHLHLLIWVEGAPGKAEMEDLLQHDSFRQKIKDFLAATIRADIDGRNTEGVLKIPKQPSVSYSRPVDPLLRPEEAEVEEKMIARAVQYHQCSLTTCLKTIGGRLRCKRRAPFALSEQIWVNEKGEWGVIRNCPYLNAWNPPTLQCTRSNQDIKLIVSAGETCSVVLYCANYQTKKQSRTSNATAITTRRWAIGQDYLDDLRKKKSGEVKAINQGLLQHCAHRLLTEREFSAMEIMSYLMNWGDRYLSHHYTTIYWTGAMRALKAAFPGLKDKRATTTAKGGSATGGTETDHDDDRILTFVDGKATIKDQLKDYQYRGHALEDMSFFDFCVNTYDKSGVTTTSSDQKEPDGQKRGRPLNTRIPYLPGAEKPKSCRVIRTAGHETVPRFVGPWFPRSKESGNREFYCASALLLLKPWRSLKDLKHDAETFDQSFCTFQVLLSKREQHLLDNFEYYYDCWDAASRRREEMRAGKDVVQFDYKQTEQDWTFMDDNTNLEQGENGNEEENDFWLPTDITEDMIEDARQGQYQMRDILFADSALETAKYHGLFEEVSPQSYIPSRPIARPAFEEELSVFQAMDEQLKLVTRRQLEERGTIDLADIGLQKTSTDQPPEITLLDQSRHQTAVDGDQHHESQEMGGADTLRPFRDLLNEEQRRSHDIVEAKLLAHLEGRKTEQLQKILMGSGGTGKTMLIKAIAETFGHYGCSSLLAKCGSSGVAATAIGGMTLHSWAGIGIKPPKGEAWLEKAKRPMRTRRENNMVNKLVVIIDEMSMVTKPMLSYVSKAASYTRAKGGVADAELPFGGLHVVLSGDFHQLPPVAGEPLYSQKPSKNEASILGSELYKQFDTVVHLDKQIRARDPVWTELLERLRIGECTDADVEEVQKLVLTNPDCEIPDFTSAPWNDCVLVTTRNAVRTKWNDAAIQKHCSQERCYRYIIPSEDTKEDGTELPMDVRLRLAGLDQNKTGKLVDRLELAIGMKAMVILNLATEADVANGTRGIIEDIILDHRDTPEIREDGSVLLRYPPALIVFKPDSECTLSFDDVGKGYVPAGRVPIVPTTCTFDVARHSGEKMTVARRQVAITAAYAFTDYKSQGQTIEYVIIDLADPPSGKKLSPFSAYVALSRSRGRNTIRLLRDFNPKLFQAHPSPDLKAEMDRLLDLNEQTKARFRGQGITR